MQIQILKKQIGEDSDKYDLEAELDSSLSLPENITQLKTKYPNLITKEVDVEGLISEYQDMENERIEKIQERAFKQIMVSIPEIDKFYDNMHGFMQTALNSEVSNMFIIGSCGLGKSYNVLRFLKDKKVVYKQGNITPLAMYMLFWNNNSEDTIIVFDDTHSILNNKPCLSLLYSAMWSPDGIRIISWDSTSGRLKNTPSKFQLHSKIMFLMNEVPNNEEMRTLLSRCFTYHLKMNYNQILELMYHIAKLKHKKLSKEQRFEVVNFIKQHSSPATQDFNLRLQKKIEELYLHNKNWQDLAMELLQEDELLKVVWELEKEPSTIKTKIQTFQQRTNMCRATYYNYKKQLSKNLTNSVI